MPIVNMPLMSAFGNNLKPYDGAKMFFYEAGTTTDKTTYTTNAESVEHPNPVVADADGRFPAVYLSGTFKQVLKDKNDVTIWTEDNLQGKGGQITYLNTTDFDSTTNAGDYPDVGGLGDHYRVGSGFTLNAASGGHILKTGDFITCNKAAASAIDADWDITRGKIQNVGTKALVDGANIPTDCSAATNFTVTLGDNRTLDNPTNKNVGQSYTWIITQDGTGSRTLAFGTDFDFQGSSKINPTIASVTVIKGEVVSSTSIRCYIEGQNQKGLIQVQQGTYATEFTLPDTSINATGLNVAITPTSIDSKILISVMAPMAMRAGGAGRTLDFRIYDGSTDIASTRVLTSISANEDFSGTGKLEFLHSPALTSAITYTLRVIGTADSPAIIFTGNTSGFITATEIINPT